MKGVVSVEITYFGIYDHADGCFQFGRLVNEDVAETVRVSHDWDPGVILDVPYKGITSPWDN